MYQVSIFNSGTEKVIHVPDPSQELPHVTSIPFKESLSMPEQLSFVIPIMNPGYNLINGLTTKVKIFDTRDNSVVFSGRVITIKDGMTSDGKFYKTVACEGALAYFNDSQTRRWHFANQTPQQILQYILDQHNSKMDDERKIYLGTVEITQPITIDTNYETTLNAIVAKIKNILGGDISVRETDSLLYLDYLTAQGANNEVPIRIGYNLKELIREYDPRDIVTRVIPLGYGEGINQLDITKVNSGIEYVEDSSAISQYGIIEGVGTNKDIQNADTLKIFGQTFLNEKKQPRFTYTQTASDLSVLSGHENEKYNLGDTLHTLVDILNIDVYARVIERSRDLLLSPWNPTVTISTRPIKLTNQIIDLKQRSQTLENAPQGNTCIFPYPKAENCDSDHPMEFDLDIPDETININRVYVNMHGRRFRADNKDTASGGGDSPTSEANDIVTTQVDKWGSDSVNITAPPVMFLFEDGTWQYGDMNAYVKRTDNNAVAALASIYTIDSTQRALLDLYLLQHKHKIPSHYHTVVIKPHTHGQTYGIYEDTYPKNVRIIVNGQTLPGMYGGGTSAFDNYNIDITAYVSKGNNKIQITTEQNGRIEAVIYSQIFIQSK